MQRIATTLALLLAIGGLAAEDAQPEPLPAPEAAGPAADQPVAEAEGPDVDDDGAAAPEVEGPDMEEPPLTQDQLPSEVLAAMLAAAGAAQLGGLEKERLPGPYVYIATFKTSEGEKTITVGEDGKVISVEVEAADEPEVAEVGDDD